MILTVEKPRRQSPGADAFGEHARRCQRCLATAKADAPLTQLCVAGRLLAQAALLNRQRRVA